MNEKKGLSIASLVLGIIGLLFSCILIGIIPSIIGLVLGITALSKRQTKAPAIIGIILSSIGLLVFLFVAVFIFIYPSDAENNNESGNTSIVEQDEIIATPVPTVTPEPTNTPTPTPTPTPVPTTSSDTLSDEEYMAQCEQLWHDNIFFSSDSLEGKLVKLDLFVEEEMIFEEADYLNSDTLSEYQIKRNYYNCGVKREGSDSYMSPGKLRLCFSDKYSYSASDINVGDNIVVYGEVIDYSTISWDGYNFCVVVPRFIE